MAFLGCVERRWVGRKIKPGKNKGVPLLGHTTACRPACPFLGHSHRGKLRFSSRAMEQLQNIDSLRILQGERKYQARLHSKLPIDQANNKLDNILKLSCEQGTVP